MISEIDLQMLRDLSRDSAAFEQLTALVERLIMTAVGAVAAPPTAHQLETTLLAAIIHSSQDAIYTKTLTGMVTSSVMPRRTS